jgi:hypothetical protein
MTEEKGRESREANALFYVCSLIEFIARMTKNRRNLVAARLGEAKLRKMFDLADVYHSDNIERVASDFIAASEIETGSYDNVSKCRYSVPSHWDIGKVYKRLILGVAKDKGVDLIAALQLVYDSFLAEKIDDYNTSVYYDSPAAHLADFKMGSLSAEQ